MQATWNRHECERLGEEIRTLSDRLRQTTRRPGLRSRSKHSFLSALLAHKREHLSLLAVRASDHAKPARATG